MPGFFDNFVQESGNWIAAEEKAELAKQGVPLNVVRIFQSTGEYGPKYNVVIDLEGEERTLSFGAEKVPSRDRMFDAMIGYLEDEEAEPIVLKLTKVKQAYILKDFNEE
jgi:hypothetical protein